MKTPVGLVTAALAVAILLAVSFLIATGTRGEPPAFGSSAGELEVRTVARGLVNPWALAFLPDGTMLVTERPGRMRIVTAKDRSRRRSRACPRCGRRARAACSTSSPTNPLREQNHLFLLCRAD